VDSLAKRTRAKTRTRRSPKRKRIACLARYLAVKRRSRNRPASPTFHPPTVGLPLLLCSVLRNRPSLSVSMVTRRLRLLPLALRIIMLDILYMSNEPSIALVTSSSLMLVDRCLNKS
jgi:hypothetical protein